MNEELETREIVRKLVKCMEAMAIKSGGIAFAAAHKNPQEYEKLLASAGRAEELILKPILEGDEEFKSIYNALDNPESNWRNAIEKMLVPGPRVWFGDEAFSRMRRMESMYARFEAEERRAEEDYKGDAGFAT